VTQEGKNQQLARREDSGEQVEMFSEMVALERERIASRDRMTAAIEAGFANAEAADQRQFKYQMDRLERDDNYRLRRLGHLVRFGWYGAAIGTILLGFFVYAIMWGTPEQRAAAITFASATGAFAMGFLAGRYQKIATS
jgi:hypothetical protein